VLDLLGTEVVPVSSCSNQRSRIVWNERLLSWSPVRALSRRRRLGESPTGGGVVVCRESIARCLVSRVSGIVGWDEGALSFTGHERPAESGLQVVVVGA
jgi:hypothetical protein